MSTTTKKFGSRTRASDVPTLAQMVRDRRADAEKHRQLSAEALDFWFQQSERLNIARTLYGLTPFSREDGPGLTAFVRKAIAEQAQGTTSVVIVLMPEILNLLIAAAAEVRPMGRVPFIDITNGRTLSTSIPVYNFRVARS